MSKRIVYQEALQKYNLNRTEANRMTFIDRKKEYKRICRISKRNYNREFAQNLHNLKNKKPREFWKMFKDTKNIDQSCDVDMNTFFEHFKNLASDLSFEEDEECIEVLQSFDSSQVNNTCFEELDSPITINEIRKACKKLKTNKSCSIDNILYEYFIHCIDVLEKPLEIAFNYILDKQSFPKSWSKGVIISVHKKGDNS